MSQNTCYTGLAEKINPDTQGNSLRTTRKWTGIMSKFAKK
jgi:hypothetical protein